MLTKEELSKETLVETSSNWKSNYQNKDGEASNSKKVHTINLFTKYTL